MPNMYVEDPVVSAVAAKIIPNMEWLDVPKIKFLMLIADRSNCLGKCSKATGKWKHLTGIDYVIEVWQTFWDSASVEAKEALLYHELMHIISKETDEGEIKWGIRKHDLEEFFEVAEKYGAWDLAIKTFVEHLAAYKEK